MAKAPPNGNIPAELPVATDDGCAEKLRALADPIRLKVLRLLMDGPRHVGEINADVAVEQSLLSHHLRVLREAGLVDAERDGKAVLYSLSAPVAKGVKDGTLNLSCCQLKFGK